MQVDDDDDVYYSNGRRPREDEEGEESYRVSTIFALALGVPGCLKRCLLGLISLLLS